MDPVNESTRLKHCKMGETDCLRLFIEGPLTYIDKQSMAQKLMEVTNSTEMTKITKPWDVHIEIFVEKCINFVRGGNIYIAQADEEHVDIFQQSVTSNFENLIQLLLTMSDHSFYRAISVCLTGIENSWVDILIAVCYFLAKHIKFFKTVFADEYSAQKRGVGLGHFSSIVGRVLSQMIGITLMVFSPTDMRISEYRCNNTYITQKLYVIECTKGKFRPLVPLEQELVFVSTNIKIDIYETNKLNTTFNEFAVNSDKIKLIVRRFFVENIPVSEYQEIIRNVSNTLDKALLRLRKFSSQQHFRPKSHAIHSSSLLQISNSTTLLIPVEGMSREITSDIKKSMRCSQIYSLFLSISICVSGSDAYAEELYLIVQRIYSGNTFQLQDNADNIPFLASIEQLSITASVLMRKIFVYRSLLGGVSIKRSVFHYNSALPPIRLYFNFGEFFSLLPVLTKPYRGKSLSGLVCNSDETECWELNCQNEVHAANNTLRSNVTCQPNDIHTIKQSTFFKIECCKDYNDYVGFVDDTMPSHRLNTEDAVLRTNEEVAYVNRSDGIYALGTDSVTSILPRTNENCVFNMTNIDSIDHFISILGCESDIDYQLTQIGSISADALTSFESTSVETAYALVLNEVCDTFTCVRRLRAAREMLVSTGILIAWSDTLDVDIDNDNLLKDLQHCNTPQIYRSPAIANDALCIFKSISLLIFNNQVLHKYVQILCVFTLVVFNRPYLNLLNENDASIETKRTILNVLHYITTAHIPTTEKANSAVNSMLLNILGHLMRRNIVTIVPSNTNESKRRCTSYKLTMKGLMNEGETLDHILLLENNDHFQPIFGRQLSDGLKKQIKFGCLLTTIQKRRYSTEVRNYEDRHLSDLQLLERNKMTTKQIHCVQRQTGSIEAENLARRVAMIQLSSIKVLMSAEKSLHDSPRNRDLVLPILQNGLDCKGIHEIITFADKVLVDVSFEKVGNLYILRHTKLGGVSRSILDQSLPWDPIKLTGSDESVLSVADKKFLKDPHYLPAIYELDACNSLFSRMPCTTRLQLMHPVEETECQHLNIYQKGSIIGGGCGLFLSNIEILNYGPSSVTLLVVPATQYQKLNKFLNDLCRTYSIQMRSIGWKPCDLMRQTNLYLTRTALSNAGILFYTQVLDPHMNIISRAGSFVEGIAHGTTVLYRRSSTLSDYGNSKSLITTNFPECNCHMEYKSNAMELCKNVLLNGGIIYTTPPSIKELRLTVSNVAHCKSTGNIESEEVCETLGKDDNNEDLDMEGYLSAAATQTPDVNTYTKLYNNKEDGKRMSSQSYGNNEDETKAILSETCIEKDRLINNTEHKLDNNKNDQTEIQHEPEAEPIDTIDHIGGSNSSSLELEVNKRLSFMGRKQKQKIKKMHLNTTQQKLKAIESTVDSTTSGNTKTKRPQVSVAKKNTDCAIYKETETLSTRPLRTKKTPIENATDEVKLDNIKSSKAVRNVIVGGTRNDDYDITINDMTINEDHEHQFFRPAILSASGRGRPVKFQRPIFNMSKNDESMTKGESGKLPRAHNHSTKSSLKKSGKLRTPDHFPVVCNKIHREETAKCTTKISSKTAFTRHHYEHEMEKNWHCVLCIQQFATKYNLTYKEAESRIPFNGRLDGKPVAFHRAEDCSSHIQTHYDTEYKCRKCGKVVKHHKTIKKHIRDGCNGENSKTRKGNLKYVSEEDDESNEEDDDTEDDDEDIEYDSTSPDKRDDDDDTGAGGRGGNLSSATTKPSGGSSQTKRRYPYRDTSNGQALTKRMMRALKILPDYCFSAFVMNKVTGATLSIWQLSSYISSCKPITPTTDVLGYLRLPIWQQQLKHVHLDCLQPNRWLNDTVVNAYIQLMAKQNNEKGFPSIYCIDSIIFYKQNGAYASKPDVLRNLLTETREMDITKYATIFVPVLTKHMHWSLAVANMQKRSLIFYSMNNGFVDEFMGTFAEFLLIKENEGCVRRATQWRQIQFDLPRSVNANKNESGVLTCMISEKIALTETGKPINEDVCLYRSKIKMCILANITTR